MTLFYPAQLDSVRFARTEKVEVQAQRALRATGDMMLELIDGRRRPVFSAVQVFDGGAVLDIVASTDENAIAFLDLIAEGRIQMRILPKLVTERDSEANTFSLINAFVSAIENCNFKFSAWPELSDSEVRADVAAVLLGRSKNSIPSALGSRLAALQRLDRAFRKSEASERAVECDWDLRAMVEGHVARQDSLAYLRGHLSAATAINEVRETPYDLNTRSGWYNLLDAYLTEYGFPGEHGAVRSLRRTVDIDYNRKIAKSLGAVVSREDEDDKDLRSVLEDPSAYRYRREASLLLHSDAREEWFSWSELHGRLGPARYDIERESAETRDRRIKELVQDGYLAQLDQSRFMFFVKRATKGIAAVPSRASGSVAGVAVGANIGDGITAIVTGAVVGAVVGGALSDVIDEAAINKAVRNLSLQRHLSGIQEATTADADVDAGRPTRKPQNQDD